MALAGVALMVFGWLLLGKIGYAPPNSLRL